MKVKIFLLFLLLVCFVNLSFCQNVPREIDSITHVLSLSKEDSNRVNTLNVLSKRLWLSGYYDRALENANKALTLAQKLTFKRGIANSYNNIGIINVQQANYSEALKNYLIALQMRLEMGDKVLASFSYINIGNVYLQQGNYPAALKNYFTALKIGEEIKENGIISNTYNSIGNVYAQQNSYPEALKSYFSALENMKGAVDPHAFAMIHNNIGEIYTKEGSYSEALKIFIAALERGKVPSDTLTLSSTYGNIGNIYLEQGKYDTALKNYFIALELQQKLEYKYGIADSYIHIGEIYFNMHKIALAQKYLHMGLALAREKESRDEIKDAYNILSQIGRVTGNFQEAYKYMSLYSDIKDSLLNENSNKQISQLKIQYETDKKDARINTQNFQLKTQDLSLQNQMLQNRILHTRIYYSIAISLIVLLFFYLRNIRKKKEYEHKMIDLELTALKSQLNPHFIFNALISIEMYIDANPQTGTSYLNKFSQLMRGVLESSEEKEISLAEEIKLMTHYIELEKLRLSNKLQYLITFAPDLDTDKTMIPSLITQPIIENAIWHGLPPPGGNRELNIHCSLAENNLVITIHSNSLNGKANNVNLQKRKSFGVKITRERLALLKQTTGKEGKLMIDIQPEHTNVEIIIPLKKKRK